MMLNIINLSQIYKIAKQWFDVPWITVFMCIVGTTVFVRHKQKVVGFAVRTGNYLHYIAVDKEYQHQGYGRKLFSKILPHVQTLNVKVKLRKAINFYKAHGFRVKRSKSWITGRRYLMVKTVHS